jgi:hypothetical protein
MSFGDLESYYFRMISRLLVQMNVPKNMRAKFKQEIHSGLKAMFEIESLAKLDRYDKWLYISKCEVVLVRDYSYNVDDSDELKL